MNNSELIFLIALKLDLEDLKTLSLTNKILYQNIQKDKIWTYKTNKLIKEHEGIINLKEELNLKPKRLYELVISLIKIKISFDLDEFAFDNIYAIYHRSTICSEETGIREIPKEIKCLTNLKILNLNFNWIEKIPKEVKKLTNLEKLDLCYNRVKEIPEEIKYLINLKEINLSNNRVKEIPKEIKYLINLKEINLCNNRLTKLPEEIKYLTNLEKLSLEINRFGSNKTMFLQDFLSARKRGRNHPIKRNWFFIEIKYDKVNLIKFGTISEIRSLCLSAFKNPKINEGFKDYEDWLVQINENKFNEDLRHRALVFEIVHQLMKNKTNLFIKLLNLLKTKVELKETFVFYHIILAIYAIGRKSLEKTLENFIFDYFSN
jgi:Leucine rich repeat